MRELAHQSGANGGLRELALFAGAGGGILGGHILGWRTVCAVEYDPYAASVLCARQNDGVLSPFPIWDDVRTFDGARWRGRVDVVSGGFPCTDISCAGNGAGIEGKASGLWREMARIVGEVRPRFVFVENSPNLVSRGLAVVLGDLAALGYDDIRWCVLGADDAGAPHRRKRIWIVAESNGDGCHADHGRGVVPDGIGDGASAVREYVEQPGTCGAGDVADAEGISRRPGLRQDGPQRNGAVVADAGRDVPDADGSLRDRRANEQGRGQEGRIVAGGCGWWQSEPVLDLLANGLAAGVHGADATIEGGVGRVAVGVPARVQRLKCIGNGQVPLCAAMAWQVLTASDGGEMEEGK